jgi:glycosyltransferase involved in cell wall biosynthesis
MEVVGLPDPITEPPASIKIGTALIVGNFLSSHGRNRTVCEDLADRLQSAGWDVLTTSRKTGRVPRLLDMLSACWRWRACYQVAQIDLYSGLAFFWAFALGFLLRRLHKPFVLTLHGGNLPAFSKKWPRSVRWLLQSAAAVTAPSGYLAETLRPFREDIEILPNAVDISAYPFRLRRKAKPEIVWLRAFHHIYQPTLAVVVLAELLGEFPDAHLIMAGPDKRDGSLQATQSLAISLGVSDRIEYTGGIAKAEVPACINRGDVFLNTSTVDNHPVTLIEAMACGACVVTTGPGGIPYLVRDQENGVLVAKNEGAALAEGIAGILRNPKLAESLSQAARRSVEAFDWTRILPRWSSLLGRLAGIPSAGQLNRLGN